MCNCAPPIIILILQGLGLVQASASEFGFKKQKEKKSAVVKKKLPKSRVPGPCQKILPKALFLHYNCS